MGHRSRFAHHPRICLMSTHATDDQPTPSGTGADIAQLVQADIEARAEKGEATYGERLRAGNGRDALVDA